MPDQELSPQGSAIDGNLEELRKEAFTMALYVAICLLAALTAIPESSQHDEVEVFALVWGTTVGLALAHLFAFRLSARMIGSGTVHRRDVQTSLAQLVGALAVAVMCTVAVLPLEAISELDAIRMLLASFVAVVAYLTARSNDTTRYRALLFAGFVLVVALAIVVAKNVLSGH